MAAHDPTPLATVQTADRPCVDCLDDLGAVRRRRLAAARPVAFWLVAALFAVTMLGTTLPTPLYVIYEGLWHFSSGVVTLIFASYAGGVLAALLLAGHASDQVGRKPVLATALGFSTLSTVAFIVAPGLGWLFAGRVLSGLSAGLMTGTATATLTDLSGTVSSRRASLVATAANMGGLATANRLAPAEMRGQVASTYFVFAYVGLTIPVIGVGIASDYVGDVRAVLVCSIVLAVLCAFSMVSIHRARTSAASTSANGKNVA